MSTIDKMSCYVSMKYEDLNIKLFKPLDTRLKGKLFNHYVQTVQSIFNWKKSYIAIMLKLYSIDKANP